MKVVAVDPNAWQSWLDAFGSGGGNTTAVYVFHPAIYIVWVIIFAVMLFEVILYHLIFSEFIRNAVHPFPQKSGWFFKGLRWFAKFSAIVFFHILRLPIIVFLLVTFPSPNKPEWIPPIVYTVFIDILMASYVLFVIVPIYSGASNLYRYGNGSRLLKYQGTEPLPHVLVAMPIYNEGPQSLVDAVKSIIASNYPKDKLHLFCSFDDIAISELYLFLLSSLGQVYDASLEVPGDRGQFSLNFKVDAVNVTVSRCIHGGKRSTNQTSYSMMNKLAQSLAGNIYYLWVDSDIVMYDTAINNAVCIMNEPKTHRIAVTGYISVRTKGSYPLLCDIQNAEYLTGQVCLRAMESSFGAATCLPGAFVMVEKVAFEKVVERFFHGDDQEESLYDFHRKNLGEDRYLSHLMMEEFPRGSIGFASGIRSKTEAPDSMTKLIKQRRRWLLGAISNEVFMFTCLPLYWKFPLLIVWKYLEYSLKSISFVSMLTLMVFATGKAEITFAQLLLVLLPLLLLFALVVVLSIIFHRYKMIWAYLIYALINPFVTIWVNFWTLWTWKVRTWGGPRAEQQDDAASMDTQDVEMKTVPTITLTAPTRPTSLYIDTNVATPNSQPSPSYDSTIRRQSFRGRSEASLE